MSCNFRQIFQPKEKYWTNFLQSDLKLEIVGVVNKRIDYLNPIRARLVKAYFKLMQNGLGKQISFYVLFISRLIQFMIK